jgi:hypothetical protein
MVEARARSTRSTRRGQHAEDPAAIPAALVSPPEPYDPGPGPQPTGLPEPPSAVQRTERAVTSLREDLAELIALLKSRPVEPVFTIDQRQEALDRAREYVEGLLATRSSFVASSNAVTRLDLELQVAAFLLGERAEPPRQLPADHQAALTR